MRLLIIEDNHRLNNSLKTSLSEAGYAVDTAFDGPGGQELAESGQYDAIVLDVMLPDKDGMSVCRDLRKQRINTPIIMLTAMDTVEDRVQGLDSGADDYLVKPFSLSELQARLRALLRRDSSDKSGVLTVGDLILDPARHEVKRGDMVIDLRAKEYALLEYLMRHPNRLITREMVETHIWDYNFEGTSNVVDVYIRRLRLKIDDPFSEKLLETIRGSGYRLSSPVKEKGK